MIPNRSSRWATPPTPRGQTTLVAVAVALLVLTAVGTVAVVVAQGAIADAERDADERRTAVALSERAVSADGPLAARANVLNASRVEGLDGEGIREVFPASSGAGVRIALDGERVAETGDPRGGTTIRRVVLVEDREARSVTPAFRAAPEVTLPRRTPEVHLRIDPPAGTQIRTVRANDRVVLHDPAGLDGEYAVGVSRFETATLSFGPDTPPEGSVEVTYFPARTTKAVLEVTVDD